MMKTLLAWSSGKDSAWTLHVLKRCANMEVAGLFTTLNQEADRVAMHAVRRELVMRQAEAARLPVDFIPLPSPCSNEQYESAMAAYFVTARNRGVSHAAFGDLFLEDVRKYRQETMRNSRITPIFPIFGSDTRDLARAMVAAGVQARITCVDPKQLSGDFAGRRFDARLLSDLPTRVDSCGENGEFHTFVTAGPMFEHEVPVTVGETIERDGFVFTDLWPARETPAGDNTRITYAQKQAGRSHHRL
jgi:uncharacterized protein (TIGR00290 family)